MVGSSSLGCLDIESESEEDLLDEGEEEVEDEHDQEPEVTVQPEPLVKKVPEVSSTPRETERQLSKKERKKKELAELDALLADFGVSTQMENAQDVQSDVSKEKKEGEANGVGDSKNVYVESKSAKKKKKKDKSSKEVKEPQGEPNSSDVTKAPEEGAGTEEGEDASAVDMKERLKKIASAKKKKGNKELDGAARAAAVEAAARSARLAAAKKKEKNHYNQQPVRCGANFVTLDCRGLAVMSRDKGNHREMPKGSNISSLMFPVHKIWESKGPAPQQKIGYG
ncbi:unnamed protein product [Thlaspi arvense]|uniref:Uncharacterized protein n=1 Tax=Thlaspi arvense TaxID=13288 RepID=A0AAU9T1Q5_THLAR|nr:unnamed protein product [Thlaspi arvense]